MTDLPSEKEEFKKYCKRIIKRLIEKSYPSLKNTKIHFHTWKQLRGSMMTFYFFSFWIFADSSKYNGANKKAITGVLAHELVHVEYLKQKNYFQKAIILIKYLLSPKFKRQFERETDRQTIRKGYGKELAETMRFRMQTASKKDKEHLNKYYLSDKEINAIVVDVETNSIVMMGTIQGG